jgi:hypothetical protein
MLRSAATLLCAIVLGGGCASPVTSDARPTTEGVTLAPTAPVGAPTGALPTTTDSPPSATPTGPDLSTRPLIWFTPHPETRLPTFNKGSADFFDLFDPSAAWSTAANHVQIFKIYDNIALARTPTDDEYRTVIDGVRQRGMALAMELGPLPTEPFNTECGQGVEGSSGKYAVDTVQRIKSLGGTVDFVAFDEPLAFGHFYDGANACHWSVERVASEVAVFVEMLRAVEPNVVVGDIEPAWIAPEIGAAEVAAWLEAYQQAAGEPLGFFHLDVDWARDGWPNVAHDIESAVRAQGVPFGIIYNGGEGASSDEEWLQLAAERAYQFEQVAGGRPDHVNFQTWHFYPTRVLPESDLAAFTGLINRYFGERTVIELADSARPVLKTVAGVPVAGVPVAINALPLDGPPQTLAFDGTVPLGAESAVVVVRVNSEEAGPGPADLNVHEVSYSEDGGQTNAVRNPRFRQGLEGWASFGEGNATVMASDQGDGRMLHLTASPSQLLHVDSLEFDVTAGAGFSWDVSAAVPIESADSAYVALIFLAGTEIERHILPLAPQPLDVGQLVTGSSGEIPLDTTGVEAGRYRLIIDYNGDMRYWPAVLESEAMIGG